jgi:glycosyltransferase involved in cell wall biosynthesis
MRDSRQSRILWLTNLPAPYRFPIWARVAESFDLKVAFLLGEKNWRNWTVPSTVEWNYEYLSLKSINISQIDLIPSIRGAKRLLRDVDLVVLGGWEAPFYLRVLLIAKRRKIPVIQFYETTADSHRFKGKIFKNIRCMVFSLSGKVITPGDAATRAVHATGIPLSKIATLFNPVDLNNFSQYSHRRLESNSPGHRYIYSGRLVAQKNIDTLLRAFAAIRGDFDSLTIAGSGPLDKDLKNLVTSLQIGDSVMFVGHQSQEKLAELYSNCETLILPSTNEVWGLVVNEALASGLHVVVSERCGVSEFVKDMQGSYICGTDQKSLQEAMSESSRRWNGYIEEPEILKFTPEKFADAVGKVVDGLLRESAAPDLVWFTNIPTPYRIPTWQILHSRLKLHLLFLAKTELGRDWNLEKLLDGLNCRYLNERAFNPIESMPLYFNFIKPIREIRKLRAKSIYMDGWESPAFFVSALYAKWLGMQLIFGYRSTEDSHRFTNFTIRMVRSYILSQADFIVTAGSASTKAVEAMGIASEKIVTLFNPVDVSWFHSFARDHRSPVALGHRYIYVGQLIERKNIATVLHSFAAIRNAGDTLTIAGDGSLAQNLKNLTATLGIAESVKFTGHRSQEELARLYAVSNTFVLASTNEVWGLVVNEALASGLHVVVSEKCGVSEFVQDMDGAFICGTDQKSLQEAMSESSRQWNGYIEEPEILKFTPERFAQALIPLL